MNTAFTEVNIQEANWSNEAILAGAKKSSLRYNRYEHFAKFIKAKYPDTKKILEVGCGDGLLSKLLTDLGYDVTAIDYIKYNNLEENGIKFKETTFELDTDISEYDLVVGLHCCEATERIIRNCLNNEKEFSVVVCEKRQGLENKKIKNRNQYIKYLKTISNKLKVTNLPIYEVLMNEFWGETIYYKKEAKVKQI